jgi:acetoin utilization protein AcuB
MTRRPISVAFDQNISLAAEMILKNDVSCLPVIDASSQLAGIITWRDLLRHLKVQ